VKTRSIVLLLFVICLALTGCQRDPVAVLSGGKPVQHWVGALSERDPKLRKEAAFKLGNAGFRDADVLPALVRTLNDKHAGVRKEAIVAISKFGSDGTLAVPALRQLLRDPDREVRSYAAKAVSKIEGQGKQER
jgi:HEAT repeat protein